MKQIISFLVIVLTFLASSTSSFECGQRKITFSGYWPWQVAVYHRKGSSRDSYTCGGTLISETFVLTAARCVQSDDGDGRRMFVRMGVRNLQELDPNGFQQHGVREIHRVDRGNGLRSDVALLELDSEVEFTEYVQPVCLNLAEELVEQVGSFVSWGDESSGLKSSISEVISDEECLRSDLQAYEEVRGSSMFCVGFKTETTLCNSDAGSGIYFKRKGVWFMGGTLAARDSGYSCSAKSNAAFNNIDNFVPWIRNVTKIQYSTEKLDSIPCTTPTNKPGMCVRIEQCQNIYKIITSPTPQPKYNYYIKQATCTQPGVSRSICCQLAEIESKHSTTVVTIPELLPRNCGKYLTDKISRGSNADLMEFPWMVWLIWKNKTSGRQFVFCHGSLVNKRYVLSSAWCVNDDSSILQQVRLGEYDRRQDPDCNVNDPKDCAPPVRDYDVESFVGHPDLDDDAARNDIALIRLKSDVTFEDHIQPVCLPDTQSKPNEYIISGWGATVKNGDWARILQKATVPAVDHSECRTAFGANPEYHIGPGVLCAGRNGTSNVCTDDNGSPLGYPVRSDGGIRFVQYGITSVFSCGANYPSIYTDVSFYMDWIVDNMEL
ncbi:serine protease grass-like [Culex pipiens pallens]|uniref:serine protease grass-like n=1 Tax=Culex pipiens pallens TaxID=42434 RepID=UPI001953C816|nr:serine protease grass-like [Culex pipiens pallens]